MSISDSIRQSMTPLMRRGAAGLQQAESWYRQRQPREQRLLVVMAGLVVAALFFLVLIEPAWTTMTRAQQALPALRTQAATVADLTAQVRALRRQGGSTVNGEAPSIDALGASLQDQGLTADTWTLSEAPALSVLNTSDGQTASTYRRQDLATLNAITLTLNEASAASLFRWLDTSARDWRLTVVQAELRRALHATGRRLPGQLSGSVILLPAAPPADD